ncbi:Protein O-mannosyltransferase 2, partial [Chytriomyces hyalinus]
MERQPFLRKRVHPHGAKGQTDFLPFAEVDSQLKGKRDAAKLPTPSMFILAAFTVLSLFTRLYKIGAAKAVVWDEAHFGKFAGYYNTRSWYTDLHPPLGKAMLGGFGNFFGWDGKFDFGSGAEYPPEVPYTAMRACCAILASFTVPLAYLTGVELNLSPDAAVFLGVMALTDIATLVLSRFILLDPLLLFFTSLSIYSLVKLRTFQKTSPLSREWVLWLAATGFSIGMLITQKTDAKSYILHWIYRIAFLIILPISIYLIAFQIHFGVLTHSGPGDSKMGSLFQYHLAGSDIQTSPLEVAYGSVVQIRFHGPGGSLLHSHPFNYPNGSQEQQATLYSFRRDENNQFQILKVEPAKTS